MSPSPMPMPTETVDSPPEVYTAGQEKTPFQACEDNDDEEDSSSADAGDENYLLLPDNRDHESEHYEKA
ncbi:hypothetical protein KI688_010516 [Linnemannia hyalina]|uniref:Uncharacterized protein n=1 Tax=Linnemannia hyalina TaxID=64524 RepID=A0A9P8BY75_9FUNG|nr:hypothetical protein KI688_010516 [Linnemannia hyalina]